MEYSYSNILQIIILIFHIFPSSNNFIQGERMETLEVQLNIPSFTKYRKEKYIEYQNKLVSKSEFDFIQNILNMEKETSSKCITLITDEIAVSDSFIHEIENKLSLPIIIVEISEIKYYFQESECKKYSEILKNAINQDCNINIVWTKYKRSAENVARLLINTAKLAIRRSLLKIIFAPQRSELVTEVHVSTQIIMNKTTKWLDGISHIENEKYIRCFGDINSSVERDFTSILCMKEMDSVPDAVVIRKPMISRSNFHLELITNTYRERYPNVILKTLCTWNGTNVFPSVCKAFPDKISNMQGRFLAISTFSWYFPYISMKYKDGTENKLIMELSRRLNFTYRFNLNNVWGTFEENGTEKGIHRDLLMGISDVGIGGVLLLYQNSLRFDFTMPYLLNGITMLVPRPKPLPLWLSIIAPFKVNLWIAVVACVLAGSLALHVIDVIIQKWKCRSSGDRVYDSMM